MATKVIIEKVNTNSIEIIGKTYDSFSYSGDAGSREKIKGQTFITLADVADSMTVRGEGHDSIIRKVTPLDKAEVSIQLLNAENLNDGISLATAILRNVWTAKGKENSDIDEIFVMRGTNDNALSEIVNIAHCLAETPTGMRALGKWYPSVNGKRVIIRLVAAIDKCGRINSSSCGTCACSFDCDGNGNGADGE